MRDKGTGLAETHRANLEDGLITATLRLAIVATIWIAAPVDAFVWSLILSAARKLYGYVAGVFDVSRRPDVKPGHTIAMCVIFLALAIMSGIDGLHQLLANIHRLVCG